MTQEDLQWVKDHMLMFTSNVSKTSEQLDRLFQIYSAIDGRTHRPTSCGRCVASAIKRVYAEYKKTTEQWLKEK
jgi:hypothetical protein